MALTNLQANITLDVYDHDGTRPSIKAIALDDNTRYVFARLTYQGATYDIGSDANVELIIIRPDKVGAQVAGEAKEIQIGQEDESVITVYGAYAELDRPAIAVAGTLLGQFIITSGDQILRTQIFAVNNGEALDADEWAGQYDGYNLDELAQNVNESVAKVDAMEADVNELKSGLSDVALRYGYSKNINEESLWQQGMINSTTGANSPSTAGQHNYRIRTTDYLSSDVQAVTATGDGYVQVYKYNQDGTFAELIPFTKQIVLIDNRYKYRVVYAKRITSNVAINPTDDYGNVALLNTLLVHDVKHSAFYRPFTFGNVSGLNGYYRGKGEDYSLFDRSTMSSEIYANFDALMTNNTDYITKTDLGASSNSDHLYAYDFCPKHVSNAKPMPKIIIISAQHGFEKASTFGLYYLLRDICQSWAESPILEYIRHHVELIIVPVVNRHGFDAVVYKNANGVNLNRNYDTPEFEVGEDPSATSYGGASPFDQPETQIVRDLVKANPDAMALLDWHNTGGGKVANYTDINWLSMTNFSKDTYLEKAIEAGAYHIANITANMPTDYNIPVGTSMCGYMTIDEVAERPTAGRWARYARNMFGMTFETPCGFPNEESAFSQDVQKANSELMGNWLATLLAVYAREG